MWLVIWKCKVFDVVCNVFLLGKLLIICKLKGFYYLFVLVLENWDDEVKGFGLNFDVVE